MNKTPVPLAALLFALGALSCQPNTIGLACTVDNDCDKGQNCFLTGFPGGFCSRGCVEEGNTTECPSGMVCTRNSASPPTLFCSNTCTDDSQCRGGQYTCRSITSSMQKACAP